MNGLQVYDCGTTDSYFTYLLAKVHTIHQSYNKKQRASVVFNASASQLRPLEFDINDICYVIDVTHVEDT